MGQWGSACCKRENEALSDRPAPLPTQKERQEQSEEGKQNTFREIASLTSACWSRPVDSSPVGGPKADGTPYENGTSYNYKAAPRLKVGNNTRHIVLHFDLNKTIVMVDGIKGQPVSDVLNGILSETTWGRVIGSSTDDTPIHEGWQLISDDPKVERMVLNEGKDDKEKLISYLEYLDSKLPKSKEGKKRKEAIYRSFTDEGQPGFGARKHFESMKYQLEATERTVSTKMIIVAFFELVAHLVKIGRSFSIVFRTFGNDLPHVVKEFNAFCEGTHPCFPHIRLDGSEPTCLDMRVSEPKMGSWYRDDKNTMIVWGTTTLEEDLKAAGGNIEEYLKEPEAEGKFNTVRGMAQCFRHLHTKTQDHVVLALRDYFPYWNKNGQQGSSGKPLLVNIKDETRMDVFFDDNISLGADTRIVDVRDYSNDKSIWPTYAHRYYICRAEPLNAIRDDFYFLRRLAEKETNYERRTAARRRMTDMVRKVIKMKHEVPESEIQDLYDPWEEDKYRLRPTAVSTTHFVDSDEEDQKDDGSPKSTKRTSRNRWSSSAVEKALAEAPK